LGKLLDCRDQPSGSDNEGGSRQSTPGTALTGGNSSGQWIIGNLAEHRCTHKFSNLPRRVTTLSHHDQTDPVNADLLQGVDVFAHMDHRGGTWLHDHAIDVRRLEPIPARADDRELTAQVNDHVDVARRLDQEFLGRAVIWLGTTPRHPRRPDQNFQSTGQTLHVCFDACACGIAAGSRRKCQPTRSGRQVETSSEVTATWIALCHDDPATWCPCSAHKAAQGGDSGRSFHR
jgi:hypothetical protein